MRTSSEEQPPPGRAEDVLAVASGALVVTLGSGRRRPQGRSLTLPNDRSVRSLAEALEEPWARQEEAWLCLHTYADNYRSKENWRGAAGVGVDYFDIAGKHALAPLEAVATGMATVDIGNIMHSTPRGFRVLLLFSRMVTDAAAWNRLAEGVGRRIQEGLHADRLVAPRALDGTVAGEGFTVDLAVLTDRARLLFTPKALVDGTQRDAAIRVIRTRRYRVR